MTRDETIKILAILKAAYPNSYKNMTKEEARGTVMVWATQFQGIPGDIVMIAVNKLISTKTFPPAISEVKEKIQRLYWEAWEALNEHKTANNLTGDQVQAYQRIMGVVEPLRHRALFEPTLKELVGSGRSEALGGHGERLGIE